MLYSSIHYLAPYNLSYEGHRGAWFNPSCHWERSGAHPAQVTSVSLGRHTEKNNYSPNNLTPICKSLDWGRKPECPKKAHRHMENRNATRRRPWPDQDYCCEATVLHHRSACLNQKLPHSVLCLHKETAQEQWAIPWGDAHMVAAGHVTDIGPKETFCTHSQYKSNSCYWKSQTLHRDCVLSNCPWHSCAQEDKNVKCHIFSIIKFEMKHSSYCAKQTLCITYLKYIFYLSIQQCLLLIAIYKFGLLNLQ